MIALKELEGCLAELLEVASFEDHCLNGIQVEGRGEVNRIVTGVSASERLFQRAVELNADAVMVHHGLFWSFKPPQAVTGILRSRLKLLLENDISLLAYHLPLDSHPEFGNNALIARALGLKEVRMVPVIGALKFLAAVGELPETLTCERFKRLADEALTVEGLTLSLGGSEVKRVFVISGSGGSQYAAAAAMGADIFVTGELREDTVRAAEEMGLNLYAAGHYNSEKWGIRALGEHLRDRFRLEVEFVDIPNPV